MNKSKTLTLLLALFLVGCQQQHDAHYYASHPKALQKALLSCPHNTPSPLGCDVLRDIDARMGHLTYQLQDDQLAYGRKILALQEEADRYRQQLKAHPSIKLEASLSETQAKIEEYLLPVQWLTSPRNRT